jgi:prepilin-type N-terminal cleavage/methylation domain-containing protein
MKLNRPRQGARGFTLVELMIVVIILSILAAIVVPQFAGSTTDAKYSALDANLNSMRAMVEVYYQQHGVYPSVNASSGGTPPAGSTAGTGAAGSDQAFIDQLTMYSNAAGQTATAGDTNYKYGPYLKKGIPVEPVSGSAAIEISTAGLLGMAATADKTGYKFDNKTGQLIANNVNLQSR